MLFVQNRTLPHIDIEPSLLVLGEFRIVPNFTFQADIGHEAVIGFGI